MTTALECRIAWANQGLNAIADVGAIMPAISAHLLAGSHGDIVLNCTGPGMVANPLSPRQSIYALELHNMLLWINHNPANQPLQHVCVIYADNYINLPDVLGIMFDRGFTTADDPNGAAIYTDRPRQGCAVFLGSIAKHRSNPTDVAAEAMFTTIHEVGHMFNLQHDETQPNFLHSSLLQQSFAQQYYHFTPGEQSQLAACSNNPSVMPGGLPFGTGPATNAPRRRRAKRGAPFDVRLSISRDAFWRFEPMQLEIEVAVREGVQYALVPEIIDPGADGFDLMVENELGERRLYRSPIISCGVEGAMRIERHKPYRRDLPLFGEAGGYTFRRAGRHRIWAELAWSGGRVKSNILEVEVRREVDLSAHERAYRDIVTDPDVGTLLFHRQDAPRSRGILRLKRFLHQDPSSEGRGELFYALARAIGHAGRHAKGRRLPSRDIGDLLELSLKDSEGSPFQTSRRTEALDGWSRSNVTHRADPPI